MSFYNHKEIEPKWQKYWADNHTFKTGTDASKPKFYALDMFPYPSGAGLHVGHPEGYTATDILSRFKRAQGYNVLHPMGWDAFGLPAEQYAMDTGNDPAEFTAENIANFKRQINALGFSYDWDREVNTTDPNYYKWTQWIFTKLYEKGLAYEAEVPVNWVEELGTAIANEEVLPDGTSERGGYPVVRKPMRQWMLKITAYAERLLNDLDDLDWPESIKDMQRNWIGKSTGANVTFKVKGTDKEFTVFTTRPDTLFGATFTVLAPEHDLVDAITTPEQAEAVADYKHQASLKSDLARTDLAKEKTGVWTGAYAVNPVNGKEIPIWIADYVLASYGTGAVMAVPAHDERDWEFAKQFDLPIVEVLEGGNVEEAAYTEDGLHVNSDFLNGLNKEEAIAKIVAWLEEKGFGQEKITYRLRDWLFSRQRYWGEPIPIIHWEDGTSTAVPESELPLVLPVTKDIRPSGTGESPLANLTDWLEVTREDGVKGRRETNTMPQWAGSSWYYLRYIDPHNTEKLADEDLLKQWLPVDIYVGGAEHAVLHLLYARFWHKFLYDIGVVPKPEPYQKRTSHGMILGLNPHAFENQPDAERKRLLAEYGSEKAAREALVEKYGEMAEHPIVKMSKSLGNVVNPDDVVNEYGADTLRLYEMFIGDFEKAAPWNTNSIKGCKRFLDRIWALSEKQVEGEGYRPKLEALINRTIKKVGEDIDALKANTAIAQLMILVNALYDEGGATRAEYEVLLQLLNPFVPHMTEELWQQMGHTDTLAYHEWPKYDEAKCVEQTIEIAVQVNGKVKARLNVAANIESADAIAAAKADPAVAEAIAGKTIAKEIYVKGRLVNIAVKG